MLGWLAQWYMYVYIKGFLQDLGDVVSSCREKYNGDCGDNPFKTTLDTNVYAGPAI